MESICCNSVIFETGILTLGNEACNPLSQRQHQYLMINYTKIKLLELFDYTLQSNINKK